MSWIIVALSAYFLLAVSNLLDKFLVDKVLPGSRAYAFIACLGGGLVVAGAPWFLDWPGYYWLLIDLVSGGIFALALWSLYESLRRGEASRALVLIGGLTPVFTTLVSYFFLGQEYSSHEWLGIGALLVGIFLVASLPENHSYLKRILNKLSQGRSGALGFIPFAALSAAAYSGYFLLTKYAYSAQTFASAFIWVRIGAVLAVLLFLLSVSGRREISAALEKKDPNRKKKGGLVLLSQAFGGAGFLLQNYAIFLGSVALVNALQGAQYAFLLIISGLLAIARPKLLKEDFSWRSVFQKTAAIIFVCLGLYLIVA